MKYSFKTDYSHGAHPNILKALYETNLSQQLSHGDDTFSLKAKDLIKSKINLDADIHFVTGGTQANLIVISSFLKPYESIISADTAHIATLETGAIEATGHKVNIVNTKYGKLTPDNILPIINHHKGVHMVIPKAVFISNTTELGTVYTHEELIKLSSFCKKHNLYLYLDGARLGSALAYEKAELTLELIASLVDVFYIGGTKNGALLGEAIVISNEHIKDRFQFYLKQKGALLAKSRLLGIQFLELFKQNLYLDLAKKANTMALKLADTIKKQNFNFLQDPISNQIFPILPNFIIDKLLLKYDFYIWKVIDEKNSAIRLVTSWATQESMIEEFIKDFLELSKS